MMKHTTVRSWVDLPELDICNYTHWVTKTKALLFRKELPWMTSIENCGKAGSA